MTFLGNSFLWLTHKVTSNINVTQLTQVSLLRPQKQKSPLWGKNLVDRVGLPDSLRFISHRRDFASLNFSPNTTHAEKQKDPQPKS